MKTNRSLTGVWIPFTGVISFLLLIFLLDPIRVIGWVANPIHKRYAQQYMNALARQDYGQAAAALDKRLHNENEWTERMNRSGITLIRYEGLRVPFDRERMDGRAWVTLLTEGQEATHTLILNLSLRGVVQACIPPTEDSPVAKSWNAIHCPSLK
jgi:hypothetical protein